MDFAGKFRGWCIKEFGTITKAAEEFGMAQGDLSKIITGKRNPGLNFFISISKFNPPYSWFFSTEEKSINDKNNLHALLNWQQKKIIEQADVIKELEAKIKIESKDAQMLKKISDYFQKG